MANQNRPPLIISAPPPGRISAPDAIPNLLITTLVPVITLIALPLLAGRVSASAPAVKAPVQIDNFVQRNGNTLGINPNAFIQRLDASAPQAKYSIEVDRAPWPITLGVVTALPAVHGLCTSAPATKIDVAAFMQVLTILPPAPSGAAIDTSQLQLKYAVYDTNAFTQRPFALGINPKAFVQSASAGAPFPKYQIQLDTYPNLHTSTLGPTVFAEPVGRPVDTSQLQIKYAVEVDQAPYSLALGINPRPGAVVVTSSAPRARYDVQVDVYPRLLAYLPGPLSPIGKHIETTLFQGKYAIQADKFPNLLENTLRPHELPIPLPLGLLHDFQLPQLHYSITFDTYPNLLPLGITVVLTPDQCKQLSSDSRLFLVQLPGRPFTATEGSRLFTAWWEC